MKKMNLFSSYAFNLPVNAFWFAKLLSYQKLMAVIILSVTMFINTRTSLAQANTDLSNLVAPTKVNVNLQPTSDNSKNLGSDSKSWKDFYLDGYLYLDGVRFISNPGANNVFVGNQSGNAAVTGVENTVLGSNAGFSISSGYDNTFVGSFTGYLNSIGHDNTFIGKNAGNKNTTGTYNTFLGSASGYATSTGYHNTAVGANALDNNSSGANNTAFGYNSLGSNTSADFNAAFGISTLLWNTTGEQNSAFGPEALYFNTTGSHNSAVGNDALWHNTSGSYNTAVGEDALFNNTTGEKNAAFGDQAAIGNTTGNFGTFVGFDAGGSNATGSQNTYLGYSTEGSSSAFTNVVGIGYQLTNTASNQARIGNSSTTSIGGWTGWSNVSDGRFKKNVKEDVSGLVFINKLRPVTYNLDVHAADVFVGKEYSGDHETDASAKLSEQAKSEKEKMVYSGFIAQEVESAAKEAGYDFSGVDAPKNEKDMYGLRYAEFVVPLVKAVQEISDLNDMKDEEIKNLQNANAELLLRIESIEQQLGITTINMLSSMTNSIASLEQNIPNPAKNSTTIHYQIPQNCTDAFLVISDANGRTVQQFNHLTTGQFSIEISTLQFSAGIYSYTLHVSGRAVDTKQMVIAK